MRITANAFNASLISSMDTLTSEQYQLQNEVSTGLRIQAPSDDPTAMENTLNYQAESTAQQQYSSNISTLQGRANSIYSVLQSLQTLTSQAMNYGTLGSDDTKAQSQLTTYAGNVNQLISQAVQLVNTKDPATGQYLFGGTASGQPPFAVTKDANGQVTGVTYQGNSSVNEVEIAPGLNVAVDIPGANTSGSGTPGLITDSQSGADLFNHLISLRNNLSSGNTSGISSTDTANIQKDEDNIVYQVSNNGVIQSQLNSASTYASNNSQSLDQLISNQSSADLMQTMVQLNQAQNAYQASLQSGAKIMQMSLLNYISP